MAVQWSAPELATRYSSHVEELQDFFALQRLHFGVADDIAPLMECIGASESFREDMTSMVRSIILHEGGTIPRANLLEIVAFAIGGQDMDQASAEVQEPLRQLLDFLMRVQRKPWNQPPGESRLQFAPSSMAGRRAPPNDLGASSSPKSATPQSIGESSVSAAKVIPITARQATYSASPVQLNPPLNPIQDRTPEVGSEAVQPSTEAAEPPAVQSFARPCGVYSRLTRFDTQATPATSLALHDEAVGVPSPTPEPLPPPPPPPPMEAVPVAPSEESAARPAPRPRAATLRPPSALDPEPPSPSYPSAIHLPIALLSLRLPRAALPAWSRPKISRSQIRIAALSAGGAAVFIAVLVFFARSRSPAAVEIAGQPHTPPASVSPAPKPRPQTTAAGPAKPSADGPAFAHPQNRPYRNSGKDGLIAKPYFNSGSGQSDRQPTSAATASIVGASPTQSSAGDTPARGGVMRPVALATTVESSWPVDPGSTYVRTAAASEAIPLPHRPASVTSAVMAANLLSAPPPGYPLLAKLAHIEGPVVLRAEIGRNGRVKDVSVLSGHHLLRSAAVDALRQWRFRPYLIDGHPAPVFTTITLQFPPHR